MKIRVHLSRLRTDTQVQNTKQMKNGESTSAPVTSVDVCGQTHKYKEIKNEWWKFSGPQSTAKEKTQSLSQNVTTEKQTSGKRRKVRVHLSRLWTDTTSTEITKQSKKVMKDPY